jgi:hypothetical protein
MTVTGSATATNPPGTTKSQAYASSYARVSVEGGQEISEGNVKWNAAVSSKAIFGSTIPSDCDPITFTVTDLDTFETFETTLLDVTLSMSEGRLDWDTTTGVFDSQMMNGEFNILIDSPFTTQHGAISIIVENGIVTSSLANGIFSGFSAPAIGSSGTFTASLGEISLDYDLGDFGGHDLDVTANFTSMGEAFDVVPEPSTVILVLLGLTSAMTRLRLSRSESFRKYSTWD